MSVPVIFDTDGGVDDCTALWWGLHSPDIEVVAVTTVFGNVPLEQVNRNIAKLLHAADRSDIPIAVGAAAPLGPSPVATDARLVHGADGLGGVGPPDVEWEPHHLGASELLARCVSRRPREITIVAVGPLTNVALAVRTHPEMVADVGELVVMGGVVTPPGNVTPVAEFNIASDPDAAAEVVAAPWRTPPLLVPLDATHVGTVSDAERALLDELRTPAAEFLAGPVAAYWAFSARQTPDGTCPSHDTLALMAAAHPGIVDAPELTLAIDTGGSAAWGQTVVDLRERLLGDLPPEIVERARAELLTGRARWRVALDADAAEFRRRLRPMLGG
jgi:purine nucleosidase